MLNPIHLQTLQAVLVHGSLSAAAHHLGYTPSAVSQQIAALERAIGVPLFERAPASLHPTAAGQYLGRRSGPILLDLVAVEEELRVFVTGRSGRLRLGTFPTAGVHLLPSVLANFSERFPQVKTSIDEGEPDQLVQDVLDGQVDLALAYEYAPDFRAWPVTLMCAEVLIEQLYVLVPNGHRLAGAPLVELSELAAEKWVCSREDSAGSQALMNGCAKAGFTPDVVFRTNDYDVVGEMVKVGLGVAVVPALALSADLMPHAVPLCTQYHYRRVVVLQRRSDPNPLLRPAVKQVREAAVRFSAALDAASSVIASTG